MEDQDAYQRAKRKVEARIGFYIHLAVYVGVNTLLIIINVLTSTEYLFKWPLIGWEKGARCNTAMGTLINEGQPEISPGKR